MVSAAEKKTAPGACPSDRPIATQPATRPAATLGPHATSAASAMPVEGHMTATPPASGKSAAAAMPASQ